MNNQGGNLNKEDLKNISLRGRVAFGIRCFENALLDLQYNVSQWRIVLDYLWSFTNIDFLDDWNGLIAEIIPENLLEFKSYEEHGYKYLDEKAFRYLYALYYNIDPKIDYIMTAIYYIGTSHAYSVITGNGQRSLDEAGKLINYITENSIPLPEIDKIKKSSINENRGWGNKFDGKEVSGLF